MSGMDIFLGILKIITILLPIIVVIGIGIYFEEFKGRDC